MTEAVKDLPLPFVGGYFSDKITVSYDASKAFVVSQQEIAKMVDSLSRELDESGDPEKDSKNIKVIKRRDTTKPPERLGIYSQYA